MRIPALFLVLLTVALFSAGCMGGPQDSDARLAEACDRQREEVAEEESGTPTAKSTDDRLDEITLVECAGQKTKVVAADAEDEDKADDTGSEKAEGDTSESTEDAGGDEADGGDTAAGGDEAATTPVKLDPEARSLFAETCGGCHTLSDAETSGAVGPNLDETEMDAAAIEQQIIKGGGGMPPMLLEGEDATNVAEYVAGAASAK
ncbi:MAG: cytochrome c class [Thermoleophilia bacterium]|nr:cytochrome c class [Thermoleophilia bacterium]